MVHHPRPARRFVAQEETKAGGKLNVDVGTIGGRAVGASAAEATPSTNGDASDEAATDAPRLRIVELHEVRTINTRLPELAKLGFQIEALIPKERTGEEGSRYMLRRGETKPASKTSARSLRPSAPPAKGPADHPLQGPRRNERRGAPRNHPRPRQPHALANPHG